MDLAVHALVGLLPVCCFLAALVFLDSYKLVSLRWILVVIGIGFAAAVASYPLNVGARALFAMSHRSSKRRLRRWSSWH
jgi:hypothetical protein